MKISRLFALCTLAALSSAFTGCQTGSTAITGKVRAPLPVSMVKVYVQPSAKLDVKQTPVSGTLVNGVLYGQPPARFEVIGTVEAAGTINSEEQLAAAIGELKERAAKIGANGVLMPRMVIGNWGGPRSSFNGTPYGDASDVRAEGQAIFVADDAPAASAPDASAGTAN